MKNFLAVGTFDGVHAGHRRLLSELRRTAEKRGLKSLAVYFPLPPKAVLSGQTRGCLLTLPKEREKLILSCGVAAGAFDFTRETANMSREEFFSEILLKKFAMAGLVAGQDFAFGRGRSGHLDFLRSRCLEEGVELHILPFVADEGHKISSSVLRRIVGEGHLEKASAELGRNYSVSGKVVRGLGLGRKLGFPTANLEVDQRKIIPRGVFAGRAFVSEKAFRAVINVGFRPTLSPRQNEPLAEAHLLNFDRDIYSRTITVEFERKIRAEKKFANLDELKEAITTDVSAAAQ